MEKKKNKRLVINILSEVEPDIWIEDFYILTDEKHIVEHLQSLVKWYAIK